MMRQEIATLKELEAKDAEIEEWEQQGKLLETISSTRARDQQSK